MSFSSWGKSLCCFSLVAIGYCPILFDNSFKGGSDGELASARDFSQREDAGLACSQFEIKSLDVLSPLLGLVLDDHSAKEISALNSLGKDRSSKIEKEKGDKKVARASSIKTIHKGEFANCRFVRGEISSNFYSDAIRLGVPPKVADDVKKFLSRRVNFRRSLQVGDKFEILFDRHNRVLYSCITNRKKKFFVYGMRSGGKIGYFYENGEKINYSKGAGFAKPLAGHLSISSGFGRRIHPVTRRVKWHSGIDYRAHYGAPVYAISDGVVVRVSYYGGYGKSIDIKHKSGYRSRYAHLSRYAVRVGDRVKRGALIGNVGATGITTGAHLHLELAKNNRTINPNSIKMIPDENGFVPNKKAFFAYKNRIAAAMPRV